MAGGEAAVGAWGVGPIAAPKLNRGTKVNSRWKPSRLVDMTPSLEDWTDRSIPGKHKNRRNGRFRYWLPKDLPLLLHVSDQL